MKMWPHVPLRQGFRSHVTSSCHDEYGKRNLSDLTALDNFVRKLSGKILKHKEDIVRVERDYEGPKWFWSPTGRVPGGQDGGHPGRSRGSRWDAPADYRLAFPGEEIEAMARKPGR